MTTAVLLQWGANVDTVNLNLDTALLRVGLAFKDELSETGIPHIVGCLTGV